MTAEQALNLISEELRAARFRAEDEMVETRAAQGWANPVLQTQNEFQGYDDRVQFGSFAEALADLTDHDQMPDICGSSDSEFDPEGWTEGDTPGERRSHLIEQLERACGLTPEIGEGEPIAWVGVDGYYTLIRESATEEQVRQVAGDCVSSD